MSTENLFADGRIEELEAQFGPDGRVLENARAVRAWHRRKPGEVKDPTAVLVSKCRESAQIAAEERRQQSMALMAKPDDAELARYAKLHAGIFAAIATEGLTPRQVGQRLELARTTDFPRLNALVAQKLIAMGDSWS